jgi:hypothetical protein
MKIIRISAEQRVEMLERASKRGTDPLRQADAFRVMWMDLLAKEGMILDRGYPRAPWDRYLDPATGDYVFSQGPQPDIPA